MELQENAQPPGSVVTEAVAQNAAVLIRKAYKRFDDSTVILKGFNMTVPKGTIYGLLGPSGCGKTTLLRALVDRTVLDAGMIAVAAKRKDNVGYMPQELGLYNDMNISETFQFFGRLYNMNYAEIKEQERKLIPLLDLPPGDSIIGTMSGGQQRRTSFAVALLHDPELLILDEPTVGVDPLLSQTIWNHLIQLTTLHKKTIIITTHYIEEARQANIIGMMRSGVLLAEESPTELMRKHNSSHLEHVFLVLSERQQKELDLQEVEEPYPVIDENQKRLPLLETNKVWNTQRFLAQLIKHLIWNKRNIPFLMLLLALPAALSFICHEVTTVNPTGLSIGVVSDEQTSCQVPKDYNCTHSGRPLSCTYIDLLRDKTFEIHHHQTFDSAKESLRRGKIWGILRFASNYTESVIKRIEEGQATPDGVVDASTVDVWLDMSNQWISNLMRRDLIFLTLDFFQNLLSECGYSPQVAYIPVRFEEAIYGDNIPVFGHYTSAGIICTFTFYLAVLFTVGSIMTEISVGLDRSLVAGMTILEVVAAHGVIMFMLVGTQSFITMFLTYYVFGYPFHGSITLTIILLFLIEIMGMAYGFMLSVVFDKEAIATYAGIGTVVMMFMTCGVVWPIEGMNTVLRSIAWAIPVQPTVESFRSILDRNWDITHPNVYSGYISSTIWTIIFCAIAYSVAKSKKICV
ncbi:LOW QUALITY PROTEIN: ABC transporter G family member 23 [Nilaparvata lugens]|uniref:LOW QUALITY PROTEIN: ABC transporter G family member 23 n=1 Tax=Nilaparvata lugens TaxID=108931 RepID=UPI00193E3C08|nr:LOW QUALITY PROTEIN: ABC transporter G family member 23 [Nilaparvata lugens]